MSYYTQQERDDLHDYGYLRADEDGETEYLEDSTLEEIAAHYAKFLAIIAEGKK